ncbi:MAG: thioredoxin-like domain-containing protein [Bacteroidales bacterium]
MYQQNIQHKSLISNRATAFFFFLVLSFGLLSCSSESDSTYSITGKLDNSSGKKLVLYEMGTYDMIPLDSTLIGDDGQFSFNGELEQVRFMTLHETPLNYLTLIVFPGEEIKISANLENLQQTAAVNGSEESALAIELNKKMHNTIMKLDSLSNSYRDSLNNPATDIEMLRETTREHFEEISEQQRQFTIDFINRNPGSLASLMALYQQVDPRNFVLRQQEDFRYYALVDSILINKYPDLEYTMTLNENVKEMKSQIALRNERENILGSGAIAPEISLPDPDGDTIHLTSLRGNYVLLDFWAAWCGPCREENPYLVNVYNKYSDKGFEIYQVSLDRTREAWIKGITEDNLQSWSHVSDLQFWSSVVVPLYRIEGIPANYLLDPDGRIIARNLRGAELGSALEEIFEN